MSDVQRDEFGLVGVSWGLSGVVVVESDSVEWECRNDPQSACQGPTESVLLHQQVQRSKCAIHKYTQPCIKSTGECLFVSVSVCPRGPAPLTTCCPMMPDRGLQRHPVVVASVTLSDCQAHLWGQVMIKCVYMCARPHTESGFSSCQH